MYLYITMFFVWSLVIILAVLLELNTQIQIGLGAFFGGMAGLITHGITSGVPLWLEFAIFAAVWIFFWLVFFLLFTIFRKKFVNKEDGLLKYIGKEFEVKKSNKNCEFGEIKINSAFFRFKNDNVIEKGEKVRIVSIDGVTCNVERI